MALNPKQELFVREYLVSLNATQAAVKAGYSVATAKSQGSRLLTHVEVKAALARGTAERSERLELSADRVLEEIGHIAHSDPIDLFIPAGHEGEGTLRALEKMPQAARRAIKKLKFTELFEGASGEKFCAGRIVDIEFWDKPKGLEMEGRHLKLFTDKVEVTGKLSLEDLITAAAERGKAGK